MGATDHPAFAETEMANAVGLHRHAPDPGSMMRSLDAPDPCPRSESGDWYDHAERLTLAYRNGRAFGRNEGFRDGFRRGTRWGMLCGAAGAGLLGAIAVVYIAALLGHGLPL